MARVAIITPAYNVAPYIRETIASVRRQAYADFEYVIVDDGSSDDTRAAALTASQGDARIRVASQPNGGSGSARNHGLSLTTAELVSFIDGDDVWEPDFLGAMVAALDAAPEGVGAAFSGSTFIDAAGEPTRWLGRAGRIPAGIFDLQRLLAGVCPPGNGSCLLLRRGSFTEVGGFDEALKSATDFEMWLRIAAKASRPRFLSVDRPLVRYRQRGDSISARRSSERARSLRSLYARFGASLAPDAQAAVCAALAAYTLLRLGADAEAEEFRRDAMRGGLRGLPLRLEGAVLLTWALAGARVTKAAFAAVQWLYGDRHTSRPAAKES